jgi:outer membrane receptor for monomeric catechols
LNPRWAPKEFNTNDRKLEGRKQEVANFFATFTHAFNDHLSVRQTLMRQSVDIDTPKVRAAHNQYIGTDGGVYVPRSYQLQTNNSDSLAGQGDLVFHYEIIGTRHQTLAGYEFARSAGDNVLFLGALPDINVYAPNNDVPLGVASLSTSQTTRNRSLGYFVNHQSRLWQDRIVLTGGLRRDTAKGQPDVRSDGQAGALAGAVCSLQRGRCAVAGDPTVPQHSCHGRPPAGFLGRTEAHQ